MVQEGTKIKLKRIPFITIFLLLLLTINTIQFSYVMKYELYVGRLENKIDIYNDYTLARLVAFGEEAIKAIQAIGERNITIVESINQLKEYVRKLEPFVLEDKDKIKQANLVMYNKTLYMAGAGKHIKMGKISCILKVAHLIPDINNEIIAIDDNKKSYKLSLIKIDEKKDLALFRIVDEINLPYLEISDVNITEGDYIYVIGNTNGLVDVITQGVIAKKGKKVIRFTNSIWYGNSGGAILYKGKIVGVEFGMETTIGRNNIMRALGVGVSLELVKEFLNMENK